jgi:chromosome segregation ATPase
MTEPDFNQVRLIVTDAVVASERRLSEGITRAMVELDRRMAEREKHVIERQDAAIQKTIGSVTEAIRQVETNLLAAFRGHAKSQAARFHSLETGHNDVNIRLAAVEERILNLEARRSNTSPPG